MSLAKNGRSKHTLRINLFLVAFCRFKWDYNCYCCKMKHTTLSPFMEWAVPMR